MNFDELKQDLEKLPDNTEVLVTTPFPSIDSIEKEYEITAKSLKELASIPETKKYQVNSGGVNLRSGPSIESLKLGELTGGVIIESSEESGDFVKVNAYVSKSYIHQVIAVSIDHLYIIDNGVNVRSLPGTNSPIVGTLNFGAGLMIQGAQFDGKWTWGKIISLDNGNTSLNGNYIAREFTSSEKPNLPPPVKTNKSKLGLHLYPPIGPDLIPFLKELYLSGRALAGVTLFKANADISVRDIKIASPSTDVVARLYGGTDAQVNPSNWPMLTRQDGVNYFNGRIKPILAADIDLKYADAIQPLINEPGYDIKGTPAFWNGMLDAAKGICALAILIFAVGTPPLPSDNYAFWTDPEMIKLAQRVATEQPVPGKFHRFDVHQYTNPNFVRPRNWNDPFTILRHQQIMKIHQAYRDVRWVFSELGDERMPEQGKDYFMSQVRLWDSLVINDTNVLHGDLWTYIKKDYPQSSNWGRDNISVFLDDLKAYLLS